MPIPKPEPQEEKKDFVMRCMSDPKMVEEYDQEQRLAICSNQYEELKDGKTKQNT